MEIKRYMTSLDDMRHLAEEVVSTYSSRLVTVSQIISDAYALLDRGRTEREKIGVRLRDILAEGNSLRRKDFDQIVGNIFDQQTAREEAIKSYLQNFLQEQGKLAEQLKDVLKTGELDRVRSIRFTMEKELTQAKQILSDFHNEEQMLMRRFKILLDRGPSLKVSEFKTTVREISNDLKIWIESALPM